ncbi:MAG: hypothetical protein IV101_05845 [Dechloromonas sp.]|uniref:hypothetical protein n=1 Tax=Dechloromonas sp. TaxID=1917218 RepID=UPI0027F8EE8B|nr:hypothetical protein [Dechloromonas sp.]MBT9520399.1 hypothetical protein [Dechloromonas sp.]
MPGHRYASSVLSRSKPALMSSPRRKASGPPSVPCWAALLQNSDIKEAFSAVIFEWRRPSSIRGIKPAAARSLFNAGVDSGIFDMQTF